MTIKAYDLIGKFEYALDHHWGYIYGKSHEMWTQEKQAAYEREYAGDPDRANSVKYGGKWIGHWVTDCSGLFAWSFSQLGGKIAHGSNSIWEGYCSGKGTLKNGRRTDGGTLKPGTAVFTSSGDRRNHIGLYIGNGTVIEAQGAFHGVTTSRITDSKWTHWGELKRVKYEETAPAPEKPSEKGTATVTGTRVALRRGPSTSASVITRIDTGESVKIEKPPEEWEYVSYNGQYGYMMKQFLKE